MNKEEIINKLNNLNINKDSYIVNLEASLVLQGVIPKCNNIFLSLDNNTYDKLDYQSDLFNKYKDEFIFSTNYNNIKHISYNDYKVGDLSSILDILESINSKEYKDTIKKLDLYLCLKDNYRYERKLRKNNINFIAGVDEVGRGPLVGPVVAACCVLPEKFNLDGLTDSKKLSEKKRNYFYEEIKKQALGYGIGIISPKVIDEINIYEATKLAMKEAINNCLKMCNIEHVLIDAMPLCLDIPTTSIIKGDIKSITISAASVLAKVTRDNMMYEIDKLHPEYNFKSNKGYPTKEHMEAISKYGILDEHRRSYSPVSNYLNKK